MTTPSPASVTVTAVVLCGGAGHRFGGDKTRADLGGRTVLDHVVDGLPGDWPVVCVGARRPTRRAVTWCREVPVGGGPAAGIAAALAHVMGPVLVALGGDMPYAGQPAALLAATLGAHPEVEAVVALDGDGRRQPLLAAYRLAALRAALPDPPAGTPLMRLLDQLQVLEAPVAAPGSLDVDTPEDLEDARHRLEP